MIKSGLSWRLAIGALVLGNAIMGFVITVNGRIGARVFLIVVLTLEVIWLTYSSFTRPSQSYLVCHLATTPATLSSHLVAH